MGNGAKKATILARYVLTKGTSRTKTNYNAVVSRLHSITEFTMYQQLRRLRRVAQNAVRAPLNWQDSQDKRASDCQAYWDKPEIESTFRTNSHWRGAGPFENDQLWIELGRKHLELYQQFARGIESPPLRHVVEWGCGGGLNAYHFAGLCESYYGVDITSTSLEECGRQVEAAGHKSFRPVLIDASAPESACDQITTACDLFLSTYVFELLPSPEYGLRVLALGFELLRPGGIALVQIRYHNSRRERAKAWNYSANATHMATYRLEEFSEEAERIGFESTWLHLVPKQPELQECRYAYFALRKPA